MFELSKKELERVAVNRIYTNKVITLYLGITFILLAIFGVLVDVVFADWWFSLPLVINILLIIPVALVVLIPTGVLYCKKQGKCKSLILELQESYDKYVKGGQSC